MGIETQRPAPTLRCADEDLLEPEPLTADHLAVIARSLAHPARIQIVRQCADGLPHCATEIVDEMELAQSTVSEHLRILREAGVLVSRKDGAWIWYCLSRSTLERFARALDDLAAKTSPVDGF